MDGFLVFSRVLVATPRSIPSSDPSSGFPGRPFAPLSGPANFIDIVELSIILTYYGSVSHLKSRPGYKVIINTLRVCGAVMSFLKTWLRRVNLSLTEPV